MAKKDLTRADVRYMLTLLVRDMGHKNADIGESVYEDESKQVPLSTLTDIVKYTQKIRQWAMQENINRSTLSKSKK